MPSGLQKTYTNALVALLREGNDVSKSVAGLKATMSRLGHSRLLPVVLKSTLRHLSASTGDTTPKLTLAKVEDKELYQELAHEARITIDPNIIGGYIHTHDHKQTNYSHKSRLLNWYNAVTKN